MTGNIMNTNNITITITITSCTITTPIVINNYE